MKCKCEYLERESRLDNSFIPARVDNSQANRCPFLHGLECDFPETKADGLNIRSWTKWQTKFRVWVLPIVAFLSAAFSFRLTAPTGPLTNDLEFEHQFNTIVL